MRPFTILASFLLMVAGCGSSAPSDELLTAGGDYDTTGARLVSHERLPQELPLWRVSDDPDLRIGRQEGEGPDVFGRVGSIIVTSEGNIIVADTRALEVRAFDPEGRIIWRAGRKGEGPGEFRSMSGLLLLPEDSVLVLEDVWARATLFSPSGEHVRSWSLRPRDPETTGRVSYRGIFRTGVIVATVLTREGSVIERDHRRLIHALTYMAPDGSVLYQGPSFFGKIRYEERISLPQPTGEISAIIQRIPPIANEAVYAVGADRVAVGAQGTGEILIYDKDGILQLVIRLPAGASTDRSRFVKHVVAAADPETRVAARQQAERDAERLPSTLPAFNRVAFDQAGRLWVEAYVPPYENQAAEWLVLDSDGALLARAKLPDGFDPRVIGRDRLIGITLNELDVPRVERRTIARSEAN